MAESHTAEPVDGKGVRLAVVTAEFNAELTAEMRRRALEFAQSCGASVVVDESAAGSWDLPVLVDAALERDDVDAAVALGAIVTGETKHDEAIGHAAAQALVDLALTHGKAIGLGITGPGQTRKQALARVDRAEWAVRSAINQFRSLARIRKLDG